MTKSLHVSIADSVFEAIEVQRAMQGKKNRSEFVEELIRLGLQKKDG